MCDLSEKQKKKDKDRDQEEQVKNAQAKAATRRIEGRTHGMLVNRYT